MRWRKLDEIPKPGQIVGVIYAHNKTHLPMSYEIMFGEFEQGAKSYSHRVCSGDMTGKGSWSVYWPQDDTYQNDEVLAWIPAEEFIFPEGLEHDEWWGKSVCRPE
jgi:hypothetical protein